MRRQPTPFDGVAVADPALLLEAQDACRNRFCQRLAASMVTIPGKASSLGRRSWRVRKALGTAAGFGRARGNVADAELGQGPAT